jgi:nitrite reductase/ring-hydroxylating ferredoxin subunit
MKFKGLLSLFIFFAFISCTKDKEGRIPDVLVDFRAALNDPRITQINSPGGAVEISGYGVAGLILYNTGFAIVAYDRCSSVNPEQRCAVTIDNPSLTATDPCSGAKFSLEDGTPVKAPAKRPLKQYVVRIVNNFEITVTN